ncbi:MAG TPA: lysophospholipid acyltransferase family protein [Gemmataceae bacterium]|jgi:hypothetical protein|nr:lysophospholipid acyltransferase family protein [Gemmataceae bacterium]
MKIRQPWLIKALGFAVAWVVKLWIGTLRYRYRPLGPNMDPNQPNFDGRYIYAFWHENMLLLAYQYGRRDIRVLISQHADGQLIAEACRHLNFRAVRGSTTRGGAEAMRQMLRLAGGSHLAITPDGPRGPRRHVQPGLVYLAAKTGLPIVPIGIAFHRAWRMRSWDRFALPHPWSGAECVTAEPIRVPEDADKEQLEAFRLRVEDAMNRATATAESRARRAA